MFKLNEDTKKTAKLLGYLPEHTEQQHQLSKRGAKGFIWARSEANCSTIPHSDWLIPVVRCALSNRWVLSHVNWLLSAVWSLDHLTALEDGRNYSIRLEYLGIWFSKYLVFLLLENTKSNFRYLARGETMCIDSARAINYLPCVYECILGR